MIAIAVKGNKRRYSAAVKARDLVVNAKASA